MITIEATEVKIEPVITWRGYSRLEVSVEVEDIDKLLNDIDEDDLWKYCCDNHRLTRLLDHVDIVELIEALKSEGYLDE